MAPTMTISPRMSQTPASPILAASQSPTLGAAACAPQPNAVITTAKTTNAVRISAVRRMPQNVAPPPSRVDSL